MTLLRLVLAIVLLNAAAVHAAGPPFVKVVFTKAVAKKSAGTFDPGDAVVAVGIAKGAGASQAVTHTLAFKAGVAGISVGTAWRIGTATSPIRLIGVNIDLVDANDTVLASDTFTGVLDGYAHSTLAFHGLVPGEKYRVILAGSQVTAGSYTMAIEEYAP